MMIIGVAPWRRVGLSGGGPRQRRPARVNRAGPRDQRGSGTMLMIGVMIVITVVALLGTCVASYAVAVHRARSAADLTALSAAVAWARGDDPCETATRIARANGTTLRDCDQVGDQVDFVITVKVERRVPPMVPGLPSTVAARAHAGPVTDSH